MSPKRRTIVIVVAALVLAVLGWSSSRLRLDSDLARMIPDADPRLTRMTEAMHGVLERMTVDVGAEESAEVAVERLIEAAHRTARTLVDAGAVEVGGPPSDDELMRSLDFVRAHAPVLIDPTGFAEIERRTSAESVPESLRLLARRLQEPEGAYWARRAATDPLGLSDLALSSLESLGMMAPDARIVDRRIVSGDGRHVLLSVDPGFPSTDIERTRRLLAAIQAEQAALAKEPRFAGIRIRTLGAHRSTLDNAGTIRRDTELTASIGLLLVMAVSVLVYRRLHHVVIAVLPAAFGAALAAAVFASTRGSIAAASAGFGAVLTGLTVDYANHVILGTRGGRRLVARPLVISAAATIVSFLALSASSLPGVREIGAFGALGILGAVLTALFVLPALVGDSSEGRGPWFDLPGFLRSLKRAVDNRTLVIAALLLSPVAFLGIGRLRFEGDVSKLNALSPETAADEAAILGTWVERTRLTWLIAEGPNLDAALEANDALAHRLDADKRSGRIREFSSIAVVLPGRKEQSRRAAAWREFWSPSRIAALKTAFDAALPTTPFRSGAFDGFLASLAESPSEIDLLEASRDVLAPIVRDRIIRTSTGVLVTTAVRTDDYAQVAALTERVAAESPAVLVVNKQALFRRVAELVGREVWLLTALSLAAAGFALSLLLRSGVLTIIVIAPIVIGLGWTLGLLGWMNIPITLVNAIFAAFLVGGAVDYSVVLLHARLDRRHSGIDETATADAGVLLNAVTAGLGFGALSLAGHPVLEGIGLTAIVGISSGLIASAVFVPFLINRLSPRDGSSRPPAIRNLACGIWVFLQLAAGGAIYFLFERPWTSGEGRRNRALNRIRRTARRIAVDMPLGRTRYLNVDAERFAVPCIIVANHASHFDSMALAGLPCPTAILVKRYVLRMPLIGRLVEDAGYFVADDSGVDGVVARARALIAKGTSIIVYPEGTRSRTGRLGRFHNGAFALARALGVKIVPVALVGTREILQPGTLWVGERDARIVALSELDPADFTGAFADRDMARAARREIAQVIAAQRIDLCMGPTRLPQILALYRFLGAAVLGRVRRALGMNRALNEIQRLAAIEHDGAIEVESCGEGVLALVLAWTFPARRIVASETDRVALAVARAALGPLRASSDVAFGAPGEPELKGASASLIIFADSMTRRGACPAPEAVRAAAQRLRSGARLVLCLPTDRSAPSNFPFPQDWCSLLSDAGMVVDPLPESSSDEGVVVVSGQKR